MASKTDKKNAIRQGIIDAAGVYSRDMLLVSDNSKEIPECIGHLIKETFYNK